MTSSTRRRLYPGIAALTMVALVSGPAAIPASAADRFQISSPDVARGGELPVSATCDGAGVPPTIRWRNVPEGTVSFLLIMDTEPGPPRPGETQTSEGDYSWTLYDVPATTRSTSARRHGTTGHNSHNPDLAYAPPCSQGAGTHTYTITVYALSQRISLAQSRATGDRLKARARGITLSKATFTVTATRS